MSYVEQYKIIDDIIYVNHSEITFFIIYLFKKKPVLICSLINVFISTFI